MKATPPSSSPLTKACAQPAPRAGAEDFQPRYSIAAANRANSIPYRLKLVRPARLTRLPPSGTRLVPTPGRLPAKELISKD